jgi:hypothetical protein
MVRVPVYRSRGPGSIPGATRFSEKQWVWNGVHSASWMQLRTYLEEKVVVPNLENREYGRRGPSRWPRGTIYQQKVGTNFFDKRRRSFDIVRSRTQATEVFSLLFILNFVIITCSVTTQIAHVWQNTNTNTTYTTLAHRHTLPIFIKGEAKQKPANKHGGPNVCKISDKLWMLYQSLHHKRGRFPIGFSPLQYHLTSTPKSNFHWPET